jgi:hypothetical protein
MVSLAPREVSLLIVETGVACLIALLSFVCPNSGDTVFGWVERRVANLARNRRLAILLVGLSAPALRLAVLPIAPIPSPYYHDEFSYLLAADTFASGRLTNPTHPMWEHFETFHVNQRPTYMSMYFPGQGMVLALGRALFGHPWFGVCLSTGAMCAAFCWMLQGWVGPGWAFVGSMLLVFRLGVHSYWMNSYWGGAVAAAGGALVLGALPRIVETLRLRDTLALAAGLSILALTRPYEGLVLAIPVALRLLVWLRAERHHMAAMVRRFVIPMVLSLLALGTALGYYNYRVCGSPFTTPYAVNRSAYAMAPYFLWQSPGPQPAHLHSAMRDLYVSVELPAFEKARTIAGLLDSVGTKMLAVTFFYLGPVLLVPLFLAPSILRDRRWRFLVLTGAFFVLGLLANAFFHRHYFAPATSLVFVIPLIGMRHLYRPPDKRQGSRRAAARMVAAASIVLFAVRVAWVPMVSSGGIPRAQVARQLEKAPGRQLAIVRYGPGHEPLGLEWVYNAADIDSARVVWARSISPEKDREIMRYFSGRTAWMIQPDFTPVVVSRIPPGSGGDLSPPEP